MVYSYCCFSKIIRKSFQIDVIDTWQKWGTGSSIAFHSVTSDITMTSWWARWRLKSPASRLFIQPFIQTQTKENTKTPRHRPLCGEFTGDRWIPAQRASNAENVSIRWRHHVNLCFPISTTPVVSWISMEWSNYDHTIRSMEFNGTSHIIKNAKFEATWNIM